MEESLVWKKCASFVYIFANWPCNVKRSQDAFLLRLSTADSIIRHEISAFPNPGTFRVLLARRLGYDDVDDERKKERTKEVEEEENRSSAAPGFATPT